MTATLRNTILVPTDFTSVAECAIMNATEIAKVFDHDICLLHIISKNASKAEKEKANEQLVKLSIKYNKLTAINISYFIKEGSIFNSITNSVNDLSASLIVMGIHGTEKDKDILGSFSYKVICSSNVPVLVVKKCFEEVKDNTIVLPVDFSKDNTASVNLAIKYAKQFNCKVSVAGMMFSKTIVYRTIISKENKETQLDLITNKIKSEGVTVSSDILIKPKTILVPTDFTPVASKALEHAIEIARSFERKLCLLHVIGKNTKPSEKEKVELQLKNTVDATKKRYGIDVSFIIKSGSIFDVIPDTANEIAAGMIVIGFHGKQGVEHIAGGFAYTVIRNSAVPVMVVKKNHQNISNNHIVVPINFPEESLEKINKSLKFAKYYKCPVHIIGVMHIDDVSLKAGKKDLLDRIDKFMIKAGVKYVSEILIRSNSLLVPVDFTKVADYAINYAVEIAKQSEQNICLLHVVNQTLKAKEKESIENKLNEIAESNKKKSGVNFSYIIEKGNLFEVISDTACEISAKLIIMGIHGKKGIQYVLGSNAFKVIKSSKIPVMVIKRHFPEESIKNIIVPVSIEHESTKKVFKAIDFAKYFGATVHIVSLLQTDSLAYKLEKEALMKNIASHIENAGINVKTDILKIGKSNAEDTFIKYAKKLEADLIIAVAKKSSKLSELLGQNFAEQIMAKSEIPLLNIIPYAEFDEGETFAVGSFVDPLGLMRKG